MLQSKLILLLSIALAMSAGVVVGRLWTRLPVAVAPAAPGKQPSWVADQLGLSPAQSQQMDAIWADTRQKLGKLGDARHTADKQRDDALMALLSSDQRAQYQQITQDYHAKRAAMDKQREQCIHEADDRSRALLDDSQKQKYDELKKARENHGHGPGTQRSTTAPAT
jgi:hypothetical protein